MVTGELGALVDDHTVSGRGRLWARDSRTRHLLSHVVGVVVLLGGVGTGLVMGHYGAALVCAALTFSVPVAVQIVGAVVDLRMWVSSPRNPPPAQLSMVDCAEALAATIVVYPAIVYESADVAELLDSMRRAREAAGGGFAMHVALVDFADSDTLIHPGDAALRASIEEGIAELTAQDDAPPVAVLFRHRRWSRGEGVFMGWERKRGKLEELTGLIGGASDTSFDVDTTVDTGVHCDLITRLHTIRYVLTLDVGNRVLPDSAWRLVATIAHPDNAAVVDPDTGLVVKGYGFVRPIDVPPTPQTLFEWALQPYPVPDDQPPPAQSFFGRDVFFGQGVIDVAAYRAVLAGRIPPDRVLSHDKLEGMHGRTAAISDARVADARVADYLLFRRREHRWARGDVHLLPWLVTAGRRELRALPAPDRWQIAKDILGHLYPVSLLALLALGWLAAPAEGVGGWTVSVLALMAQPVVTMAILPPLIAVKILTMQMSGMGRYSSRRRRRKFLAILPVLARKTARYTLFLAAAETGRLLVWLPLLADRALVAVDAVCRAGYRIIRRRRVLQWTSAVKAGRIEPGLVTRLRHLWQSCVLALVLGAGIAVVDPHRLVWALPLLACWFAAPAFAYWIARPARWLHR